MNIDDLVKPEMESEELTEEELKQSKILQEMMRDTFKKDCAYALNAIADEVNKGKTLEELRQEVYDKKSRLTKSQRDFLIGFKLDFLQECIDDKINKIIETNEY